MIKKLDELALKKEWIREARKMTLENLPAFMEKLMSYEHTYGTICEAIAAAGVAAAWAIQNSEKGNITGFQASCIMWAFINGWMGYPEDKPLRLLDYDDMLYPQHEGKFKAITIANFKKIQLKACDLIKDDIDSSVKAAKNVSNHWKHIVDGDVPFGYRIEY